MEPEWNHMPRKGETVKKVRPNLPKLDKFAVDAVQDYLMTTYNSNRPPEVAAALLALIVELYDREEPFPERHWIADHLNCSKFGIDSAVSTALARGEIEIITSVSEGSVSGRDSVVKHRYYVPCEELVSVAKRARRRAA